MIRFIIILRLLLAAALVFCVHCSLTALPGGGTIETTNGLVTGKMVLSDGSMAGRTQVTLLPSAYDPVNEPAEVLYDTTDRYGNYSFSSVHPGSYTILAVQLESRTRALVSGIRVEHDAIAVQTGTLQVPGAVKLPLPGGGSSAAGYVYIPGTTLFALVDDRSDSVVIDSVPAGVIPALLYSPKYGSLPTTIGSDVQVRSGETTVVGGPSWKFARKLILNTSASGAKVSDNIVGFPVLVRLNSGNFDFSKAQPGGADIRFVKSDATFLPYEIGRWDASGQRAEIWVKVDTIYGNDSTQHIYLYWGNPDAADESNGAAVFDTGGGFQGVWHLNETSGTRAGEASYNGFSGTYRGGLPKNVSGPFGLCQNSGIPDTDFIDMGDVLNPGIKNISVGIWIKRSALVAPEALIAKTNGDNPSAVYGYQLSIDTASYTHFFMAAGGLNWGDDGAFDISSNVSVADTAAWHHVFVVIDRSDNNKCKMFIDGIDRTGGIGGNVTTVTDVTNDLHLRIGAESDTDCSYKGAMGEVTVAFTLRSADWVKLSYMNQKEPDGLVVFGKE